MRKLAVLILCFLGSALVTAHSQIHFESSAYEMARAKAMRLNRQLFTYFYTDWCAPCKQIPGIVFADSHIRACIDSQYVCLKFNAEKGQGLALARKYKVDRFPTFLFLDAKGREIGRIEGTRSNEDYLTAIRSSGRIDPVRDQREHKQRAVQDTNRPNP